MTGVVEITLGSDVGWVSTQHDRRWVETQPTEFLRAPRMVYRQLLQSGAAPGHEPRPIARVPDGL